MTAIYLTSIIKLLILGGLIFATLKFVFKSSMLEYHSRWSTLIDEFTFSPQEFYRRLETELRSHGISNVSIRRKTIKEGGLFSHSRLYLRATWKNYQYDICGASFGKGFFISWWLLYKNSLVKHILLKIPFIGQWLAHQIFTVTYYRVDTASMFMSYAQSSVLKVIDDITKERGVRSLNESERKVIMNDVFLR